MQAVRSGTVSVANALGSGLAESPAYAAFLPGLCKQLLGEDLKMPTVATWWCGQEKPLNYAVDHLEELVIKPSFPGTGGDPIFGEELSAAERERLIAKMRARARTVMWRKSMWISRRFQCGKTERCNRGISSCEFLRSAPAPAIW